MPWEVHPAVLFINTKFIITRSIWPRYSANKIETVDKNLMIRASL